jgi:hypothetical protein
VTGYVLVLTFLAGISGHLAQATVQCADIACVQQYRVHTNESRSLIRLRVWRRDEFSPISESKSRTYIWPPIIDEQFQ